MDMDKLEKGKSYSVKGGCLPLLTTADAKPIKKKKNFNLPHCFEMKIFSIKMCGLIPSYHVQVGKRKGWIRPCTLVGKMVKEINDSTD